MLHFQKYTRIFCFACKDNTMDTGYDVVFALLPEKNFFDSHYQEFLKAEKN